MLACQRHLFSLPEEEHYLNHAYKAPLLKAAEEAASHALVRDRNPIAIQANDFFDDAEDIKTLFGNLVGCDAQRVALIPSSSFGFASALNNCAGKANGHALTIEQEYPSSFLSLQRWCNTNKQDLRVIGPDADSDRQGANWNAKILENITQETAVVVLSSVHWMSGLIYDLEAIGKRCKEMGAIFLVDGTQSVGAAPLDVERCHIDALICAGYKWLFGPYSTGLAYFGERFDNGVPLEETWMNRTNRKDFANLTDYDPKYTPKAGRYNVGQTSNFILLPIFKAGLEQLSAWTPKGIEAYCALVQAPLRNFLEECGLPLIEGDYASSHILSLSLPKSLPAAAFKEKLEKEKIYVSQRSASLRVSFHVYNRSADVEALMEVLANQLR